MSGSVWGRRRARALKLLREAPHAEELLVFYAELAEVQGRTAKSVPVEEWLRITRHGEADGPLLKLERLGSDELLPAFQGFLRSLGDTGTDVIRSRTEALLSSQAEARGALVGPEAFHARAFLEAAMTTLAAAVVPDTRESPGHEGRMHGRCPTCGSSPVVGILRDVPEALGARSLACSLCATEWRVGRLGCVHCGETSAQELAVHEAESIPHVRVEECRSCRRYLKTVDLRRRGDAVPIVDEIAAVELDLWAREQGLSKIQANVLEL